MAPPASPQPLAVVGVGASAGGLPALQEFFEVVPRGTGMAYVVILHLDRERESLMAPLLQKKSAIPVTQVTTPVRVEPDHAYVIPPGSDLAMDDGTIRVLPRAGSGAHAPIDLFFRTLAAEYGAAAVGVVLSGTGSDGTSGLRRIKEGGGIVVVQDPAEAEYDAMPRSAIATGLVDLVLGAADIPAQLQRVLRPGFELGAEELAEPGAEDREALLRQVFGRLRGKTGHDFSRYKRSTVLRRLERRMKFTESASLRDYVRLLQEGPEETQALFNDLLISVSSFFRDADVFAALEERVIPGIFAERGPDQEVRAWVAGCATGEEAYSIAMLLCEHAATLSNPPRIQVFATDIDKNACAVARAGLFPETIAADVSPERLTRFFDAESGGYRVKKAVRELVLFAVHDLLQDPPFSRMDLVSCRNVLIYLDPEAQQHALESFHYGLRPQGFLVLGSAEAPGDEYFAAVIPRQRIFQKLTLERAPLPRLSGRGARPLVLADARPDEAGQRGSRLSHGTVHLRLLESYAPPSVVVDQEGSVVHLSQAASTFLRFSGGEPSQKLVDLVPTGLRVELRAALDDAIQRGRPISRIVPAVLGDPPRPIRLELHPAEEQGKTFVLVVFNDAVQAEPALATAGAGEAAAEDLDRVRAQLDRTLRARDITIEELQAANEEFQSVNEEMRAATEEMETSREELQSVNEELITVNHEHRGTIEELKHANADLRNLMQASEIATLFLDRDLGIRRYTPSLTRLFNLIVGDQGRPLAHVTHRLRYPALVSDAQRVVATLEIGEREVQSESGSWYSVRIVPYHSTDDRVDGLVVTFYDISAQKRLEQAERVARLTAESERARLLTLMENVQAAVLIAEGATGSIVSMNHRARDLLLDQHIALEVGARDLMRRASRADGEAYSEVDWPIMRAMREAVAVLDEEVALATADGDSRRFLLSATPIVSAEGLVESVVATLVDISDRSRMEADLRSAKIAAEEANRVKGAFLATLSHEFRTPLNGMLGYADLLLLHSDLTSAQTQKVERIKDGVWHLSAMIDEILAFARMDAGKETAHWEPVDARELAQLAADLCSPSLAAKELRFTLCLPDAPVPMETDRRKASQILVNLLGNAVKYSELGEVIFTVREEPERVVFTVRDTGIGIAPEHLERIFERFWQVKGALNRTVGGTGLGLAAAREFSRLLGGDVEVQSEVGRGSLFTLWLPRFRGAAEGADPSQP